MRTEYYGRAYLPLEDSPEILYSLLCEDAETSGRLGCEMYGVEIRMGDERASRPCLTASKASAGLLLDKLVRGCVTPVGLEDILEDFSA